MISTKVLLVLYYAITLFLTACVEPADPPVPPTPEFIPKSSDTARIETGIRPAYGRDGIYIEWKNINSRDISGYRVFRTVDTLGGRPVNFRLLREIPIGTQVIGGDTTFLDTQVGLDTAYYYQVASYSRFGTQSNLSTTESYRLTRRPSLLGPKNVIDLPSDSIITFFWNKPNVSSGYYVIKVYEFNGSENFIEEECMAVGYQKSTFLFTDSLRIDFRTIRTQLSFDEGIRVFKKIQSGNRQYRWRVFLYPRGRELNFGSASEALPFIIR
ncbi:MAG: hypothetical protein SFU91_00425 [Chloroherpetonaceae bacterium]|nr:hypothetical protein [Chloroherpetonaceae bacterium]